VKALLKTDGSGAYGVVCGGIGPLRTYIYLLRKAHLGGVSITVSPDRPNQICEAKNICVLK
jgi:hypothetical protein